LIGAPTRAELERRVVMLPPSSADGAVASQVLAAAGMPAALCASAEELCATAEAGAAVLVLDEDALAASHCLSDFLDRQPAWSDIPLIVLTSRRREPTSHWRTVAELSSVRNATLLERPMRIEMLLQAVRVALRTRNRQYQLRASIDERENLLRQREMLLREVHHRVKNNLQMMLSLVRLSAIRAPRDAEPMFADLAGRLGAIGQLHTRIYATQNLTEIDAAAHVADVVDQVVAAFGTSHLTVRIAKRLEPIVVDVDTAIPLGLITTELLTNALRYAFPGGCSGNIDVGLGRHGDRVELTVVDDGVGLPKVKKGSTSTGLRLVRALAKQIGGTFATTDGSGLKATVLFPLKIGAPAASVEPPTL
jgi:two-component sensor histidine kinase